MTTFSDYPPLYNKKHKKAGEAVQPQKAVATAKAKRPQRRHQSSEHNANPSLDDTQMHHALDQLLNCDSTLTNLDAPEEPLPKQPTPESHKSDKSDKSDKQTLEDILNAIEDILGE